MPFPGDLRGRTYGTQPAARPLVELTLAPTREGPRSFLRGLAQQKVVTTPFTVHEAGTLIGFHLIGDKIFKTCIWSPLPEPRFWASTWSCFSHYCKRQALASFYPPHLLHAYNRSRRSVIHPQLLARIHGVFSTTPHLRAESRSLGGHTCSQSNMSCTIGACRFFRRKQQYINLVLIPNTNTNPIHCHSLCSPPGPSNPLPTAQCTRRASWIVTRILDSTAFRSSSASRGAPIRT